MEQRSLPLASFKEMASDPTNDAPAGEADTLERKFWKNVPVSNAMPLSTLACW